MLTSDIIYDILPSSCCHCAQPGFLQKLDDKDDIILWILKMLNGIFMKMDYRSASKQSQNFSQKARLESLKYLNDCNF